MEKHPFQTTTISVVARRMLLGALSRRRTAIALVLAGLALFVTLRLLRSRHEQQFARTQTGAADRTGTLPPCSGAETLTPSVATGNSSYVKDCPIGSGVMAPDDPAIGSLRNAGPENVPIHGPCCPLPYKDILTGDHIYNVLGECPDGYIVTGRTAAPKNSPGDCGSACAVRCTRINSEKYRLGPKTPGVYWYQPTLLETTINLRSSGQSETVRFSDLPPAIRTFVGKSRLGPGRVANPDDTDGCIGSPFGSLFTGKRGTSCDSFIFRQLLSRDGNVVPIYPACAQIETRFDGTLRCINSQATPP